MIILGVDPGTLHTGWGVIEVQRPKLLAIAAGVIETDADSPLQTRLLAIHRGLTDVIARYKPQQMAVEDMFHAKNASSALKLGHARGVILLVGAEAGLPIGAYAPALVKRAIAGRGQAEKGQVARVVGAILGLRTTLPADASDALAIAITHANSMPSTPTRK
jgi:crossover junction endodeoxyribonuclease RuvC